MPGDADSPGRVSGIRIGTGALAARGMGDNEMRQIADLMDITMMRHKKKQGLSEVKEEVIKLCRVFPIKASI